MDSSMSLLLSPHQGSSDSFALSLKQNLMLNLHSTPAPLCLAGAISRYWMGIC